MYREFFGLKELPFKIVPDLNFFYKDGSREDIVHTIVYSLSRGDGIIKVVGEIGSGKTTLLTLVSKNIPENFIKVNIDSPNLSSIEFLKLLCSELGVSIDRNALKIEIVKSLKSKLVEFHENGKKIILMIDEAQSMTVDTLEEIRLLANLETQTEKLIQILLVGQPELDVTLDDGRLKSLKDRIATTISVPFFSPLEVKRYLNTRMQVAGYIGGDLFSLDIAKKVQKDTGGLPRGINLLADKLLMAAYSDDSKEIEAKYFKMMGASEDWYKRPLLKWGLLFLLLLVALLLFLFSFLNGSVEEKKIYQAKLPVFNELKNTKDTKEIKETKETKETKDIKVFNNNDVADNQVSEKEGGDLNNAKKGLESLQIKYLLNRSVVLESTDGYVLNDKVLKKLFVDLDENEVNRYKNKVESVLNQLYRWKESWSSQNVSGYVDSYVLNYVGDGFSSHQSWVYNRKRSLKRPSFIDVKFNDISVLFLDGGLIQTSFLQKYKSDRYSDSVRKIVVWQSQDRSWKILKEKSELN